MAITSFKWWCFTFFIRTKANVSEYKYSTASYIPAFKTWMYVPTCITLTVSVCSQTPDLTQASAHWNYSKDISSVIRSATVGWSEKYRFSNGGTLCKNIVPNICLIEHNWVIFTSICGSFPDGWTVFIIVCSFKNPLFIRCVFMFWATCLLTCCLRSYLAVMKWLDASLQRTIVSRWEKKNDSLIDEYAIQNVQM